MADGPVLVERPGWGIAKLTLNNPPLNLITLEMTERLIEALDELERDDVLRAIVVNGRKSDPPTLVGSAIVDQHAAVLGALGVLAALYERRDTGKGKRVDSNLLNSALDLQIEPFIYHLNGQLYERSETGVSSRFHQAPYGIFETADGYICISLTPPEKMAEAFGDESIMAFEHPEAGTVRVLSHPVRYDGEAPPLRSVPPGLGEHTQEILADLGYWPERIDELKAEGVVRAEGH